MAMKKNAFSLLVWILLAAMAAGCSGSRPAGPARADELILVTTTSTYDSGLLDYLLPHFEQESDYKVRVVALGTGQALEQGKNGDADVVLVHARDTELQMVAEGHFVDRFDVMYNDFVILGPAADPAGLKAAAGINEAFAALIENRATFISRGDDSGTHKKEISLWETVPEGTWYVSAGSGMGDTLRMADEMQGYTLTDRATYLSLRQMLDLQVLFAGDPALLNQYGIMAANPGNYANINYEGAKSFIEFIISDQGQELIRNFKPFGETLFFPNAGSGV
jgi:tungstate transport system substrate-binding protein